MSVLIGPEIADGTVLSEYEYLVVRNALRLARSEDSEEDAISYALRYSENHKTSVLRRFLGNVMEHLGEHCEDMRGLIWNWDAKEVIFLREEEGQEQADAVNALVKLLRAGGWLAEFIECELNYYARNPEKNYHTPFELMFHLAEEAENLESDVDNAKALMKRYPERFAAVPAKAAAKAAGDSNEN